MAAVVGLAAFWGLALLTALFLLGTFAIFDLIRQRAWRRRAKKPARRQWPDAFER